MFVKDIRLVVRDALNASKSGMRQFMAALRFSESSKNHGDIRQSNTFDGTQVETTVVPEKLLAFDRLYDPGTGGWRLPDLINNSMSFEPELVPEWLSKYQPQYAPVEREVAHFYRSIIGLVRPKVIVETGTNTGYSTAWLAVGLREYCPEGLIYTIDIAPARHVFEGTDLARNIRFLRGSSLDVAFDESTIVDMLVLDSDHAYMTIMAEILRFEPILRVGGVMLLHDSIYFDGVAYAVFELMKSSRFEVITLPTPRTHGCGTRPPGMTIVRKCAATPIPNDLQYDTELSGMGVGRDPMDTEPLIDRLRYSHGTPS